MGFKTYNTFNMNANVFGDNFTVYKCEENNDKCVYYLKSKSIKGICPYCGKESNKLHATCERTIQYIPIHLKPTYINVNLYKFECLNENCNCKVFRQEIDYCGPKQKFSSELKCFIFAISLFLSDETASKILKLVGINVSNDTIRRLYQNITIEDNVNVEEIGVDDVAIKKGIKYATAIYDMKDHHLIALLDGRDGATLKEWLKTHKKIKKIARDRATAYATAINEVLPDCVQIADRFHLFQNLIDRFKEIFKVEIPENIYILNDEILDKKPKDIYVEKEIDNKILEQLSYDDLPPIDKNGNIIKYNDKGTSFDGIKKNKESRKKKLN